MFRELAFLWSAASLPVCASNVQLLASLPNGACTSSMANPCIRATFRSVRDASAISSGPRPSPARQATLCTRLIELEALGVTHERDIDDLGIALDQETVAAVIVEPVQGEGGVRVLDAGFLRELRALTRERRIALIFDEIQCGLGRTGTKYAYQHAGVEPDILTLAKPIAGGSADLTVDEARALEEHAQNHEWLLLDF